MLLMCVCSLVFYLCLCRVLVDEVLMILTLMWARAPLIYFPRAGRPSIFMGHHLQGSGRRKYFRMSMGRDGRHVRFSFCSLRLFAAKFFFETSFQFPCTNSTSEPTRAFPRRIENTRVAPSLVSASLRGKAAAVPGWWLDGPMHYCEIERDERKEYTDLHHEPTMILHNKLVSLWLYDDQWLHEAWSKRMPPHQAKACWIDWWCCDLSMTLIVLMCILIDRLSVSHTPVA